MSIPWPHWASSSGVCPESVSYVVLHSSPAGPVVGGGLIQSLPLQEAPSPTLLYSHLFLLDHLVSTIYTASFAVVWYLYTPHDGRRVANSQAQREVMELGYTIKGVDGQAGTGAEMGDAARKLAAEMVWSGERGFAAALLALGWLLKVSQRSLLLFDSDAGGSHYKHEAGTAAMSAFADTAGTI